jgi:hypothetical protein
MLRRAAVAVVAAAVGSGSRVKWAGRTDILGELPTPVILGAFTGVFVLVAFTAVEAHTLKLDQALRFADAATLVIVELRQVTCHHNE